MSVSPECLAENFLRQAVRVNIGGVEHVDPRLTRQSDLPTGALDIDLAHRRRPPSASETHGPQSDA